MHIDPVEVRWMTHCGRGVRVLILYALRGTWETTDPRYLLQGLTTADAEEKASLLRQLLATQCSTGLMHESVNVHNPEVKIQH
jgi:hypothetical protein